MLQITPIPALNDNYIWVIQQGQNAIVIDPSEAANVRAFLTKSQLNLSAILLTHNHADHTEGVNELAQNRPNLPIYGSAEVAQFANHLVEDNDRFSLLDLQIDVLNSAGHTAQHISYLINNEYLFCGDALFSGGCGRVFTGDYAVQFTTLQRFKALPDYVKVYPAHEYTQSNLRFAATVMPASCTLLEYQERADILRAQARPTLPSSIGVEKQINPFLQADTLDDFVRLRKQKDLM